VDVPTPHLVLITRVDSRRVPGRDGTLRQWFRNVSHKLQALLERGLSAKSTGFGKIGVIRGRASQIISAAILHSFGQPTHHCGKDHCLAALSTKLAQGGSLKGFEHAINIACTDIFARNHDQASPNCIPIRSVKRARSALRQFNIASADRLLKNARRGPTIALQSIVDDL
jgi:hypothetical protein